MSAPPRDWRPREQEALATVLAGRPLGPEYGILQHLCDPRRALLHLQPPSPTSKRRNPSSPHAVRSRHHLDRWVTRPFVLRKGAVSALSDALLSAWVAQVPVPAGWTLERWTRPKPTDQARVLGLWFRRRAGRA